MSTTTRRLSLAAAAKTFSERWVKAAAAADTFSERWVKAAAAADTKRGHGHTVISAAWMENGTLLVIARDYRAHALHDLLVKHGLAIPDRPEHRPPADPS